MVGKAGIEQTMETYLQGVKGSETVYVNNLGKVIETKNLVEPIAGNDLYLTIDHDLQVATYNILEQKLAGILLSKIINVKEYRPPENPSASQIKIPIDDVYYALFNNNIIDIHHFDNSDAGENEKAVLDAFNVKQTKVFDKLTVLEKAPSRARHVYWKCQCECGNIVEVSAESLRRNMPHDCGCVKLQLQKEKEQAKENKLNYLVGKL